MLERFQKYRFEDLEVWQIGMNIVHETYKLTAQFPKSETFALSDQLKRASTSIVLNIAEGSGQPTKKGFVLYIQRAKSSVLECVSVVKIALQESFLDSTSTDRIQNLLQEEYFKLVALAKSMKSSL